MRFFAISAAALSLASTTLAQSSWSTATSTRTVFAITTETRTGTPPAETQNSTSTTFFKPSYGAPVPTGASNSNGTVAGGSGSPGSPTSSGKGPSFTNAAGKTTVGSIAVLIGGAVVALAL